MSARRIVATAQRLEARAKALDLALTAQAQDRQAAADAVRCAVMTAYNDVRVRTHLSSFVCAAFEEFAQARALHIICLEAEAVEALDAAEIARTDRRRWGALSRGLERRGRRTARVRPCRV